MVGNLPSVYFDLNLTTFQSQIMAPGESYGFSIDSLTGGGNADPAAAANQPAPSEWL